MCRPSRPNAARRGLSAPRLTWRSGLRNVAFASMALHTRRSSSMRVRRVRARERADLACNQDDSLTCASHAPRDPSAGLDPRKHHVSEDDAARAGIANDVHQRRIALHSCDAPSLSGNAGSASKSFRRRVTSPPAVLQKQSISTPKLLPSALAEARKRLKTITAWTGHTAPLTPVSVHQRPSFHL